jgi:hypothetical protein
LSVTTGGFIVEILGVAAVVLPLSTVIGRADGDERHELPKWQRRWISAAFCPCMGHPEDPNTQ